jgi:hypothetical protein
VDACPLYALDAGPLEQLRDKYGDATQAEGFISGATIPAIVFKPRY